MTIGELWIELGFKADTMKLHDFIHAVGDLNLSSITAALGIGTLYEATNKIMNMADKTTSSLWDFNKSTGIGTKEAQQFASALSQVSGTSEEAMTSLARLQSNIAKVRIGEGNMRPFAMMGIDINKNTLNVMERIQHFLKTSPLDLEYKKMLALEAGLSENAMIALMNMDDLTDAMKRQEVTIDSQIETMHRYHQVNRQFEQSWQLFWADAGSLIEPVVEEVIKLFHVFTSFTHNLSTSKNMLYPYLKFAEGLEEWINPFKGDWSGVTANLKLVGAGGTVHNIGDIVVNISGVVQKPEEMGKIVATHVQKMLTNRFYQQPSQER